MNVVQEVTRRLQGLAPLQLNLQDDSARHRHHAEGGSGAHLVLRIVSSQFEGMPPLKRHRLVYDHVGAFSALGVHALAITALTPAEAEKTKTAATATTA